MLLLGRQLDMHPDSKWPAQSLPCNQSLNKPLVFFLSLKQLIGIISSREALPHLKNKSSFKIDVVDDNTGCGYGKIHLFLAAVELRKHLFLYILSEFTAPGLAAVSALA